MQLLPSGATQLTDVQDRAALEARSHGDLGILRRSKVTTVEVPISDATMFTVAYTGTR